MFRLNFKIALRNLWKYKGYTFINLAGLSIGMASCILIFIFIRYQLSFDEQFTNKDRVYRIVSNWESKGNTDGSEGVPLPLTATVRNEFPQLEKAAAIQGAGGVISVNDLSGKAVVKEDIRVFYAEPDFFHILDFKWLAGNPDSGLGRPNTVVLSKENAVKYFGDWHKAVGRTIRFKNKLDLTVTGVFDNMPENSSFPLKVVISYATYPKKDDKSWTHVASNSQCYVLVKPGVQQSELDAALDKLNKKVYHDMNDAGTQFHTFQQLKDIHYDARYGNIAGKMMEKKELYGLAIIGLFLMLTACINFINLATAQAVNRSKEVGLRKVMGSDRRQLVIQFLSETLTISTFAVLLACAITEVALPHMNNLFGEPVSFSLLAHPVIFVFLIVLVLSVSFLAGFYPAMIMSGLSPAIAIKNKVNINQSGGMGLRKVLVVVQFTITIFLIIATLVIFKQMNYVREKPLGFNPDAVALINLPADSLSQQKYEGLKQRILNLPGVRSMSFCDIAPSSDNVSETNFYLNGLANKDFQVRTIAADQDYLNTFGLKLIAGKNLMRSDTVNGFLVNEAFLKKLAIVKPEDALGKILKVNGAKAYITGVVKDFNDKSLHRSISPIVISSAKSEWYSIAVKMESREMIGVMKQVQVIWNNTFPDQVYDGSFINDQLEQYYATEKVMGVLFKVFSGVIIFISFIGLFGLISFVATQRTREVAIRKVLGATNLELVKMLNSSFLQLVFLANIAAWPLAFIFINKWLDGFAYRISLSVWPFAAAMAISMLLTLITVSLRSYKAAKTNPIDALKYE